jgi:HEAT repeats/PBS lyase HEAT-like repeat
MSANDTPVSIPPQEDLREDLTEARKPTSLLIAQFFLFPLIIIAFGLGIFVLFGSIAFDQRSPQEYLAEIRSGGGYMFESRRWQAAYELSNVIASDKETVLQDNAFMDALLKTYVDASDPESALGEDWPLRGYLAASMGQLGSQAFVPALVEGLRDPDPETQFRTLKALGDIGDPSAAPAVADLLSHGDAGVRTVAAYVLGYLGNPSTLESLKIALNDTSVDVRWNAAMALAQMDDRSGADLLIEMIGRPYQAQFTEISEEQKNENIVNAVRALGMLRLERARGHLVELSETDPSPRVRAEALAALERF